MNIADSVLIFGESMNNFYDELAAFLSGRKIEYILNEPMKAHTTFKIGGAADILISVKNEDELTEVLAACRKIPYMILGKGSNLLVSDEGIEGAVITLDGVFKEISVSGDTVTAGAGASLSKLCTVALENGLSGLEFAYGIPGTVGGAVFMNAGAYGGEMKDVVSEVTFLSESGEVLTYPAEKADFAYRRSVFKENNGIILFAKYKLAPDTKEAIKFRMDDFMTRRKTKQPLEFPSAGSVFKRPEGAFAGTLIESCSLKGASVGGAAVSKKHAGFIVNTGGATCRDVTELVSLVQDTVKKETGYFLECEIIRIGR